MSLLVVDVGNTNIVLGVYREDELVRSWRIATSRDRTADEYGTIAYSLVASVIAGSPLSGAIVASVVPPLNNTIHQMLEEYFDIRPLFVEPGIKTGLSIHMENPLEVGADRIANAVAAFHGYGGPTVVVDFGTATTFDVVSANAEYMGGVIAPGLTISSDALFSRTARLPRVELRRPSHVVGTNTVSSMQAGIYFGYLGLVDGILTRIRSEVLGLKTVVATGGLAGLLVQDSAHIETVDAELTLKGLKIIYDRNLAGRKGRRR